MRVFFFGYGYVARHLARAVRAQGGSVAGTSRSAGRADFVLDAETPLCAAGEEALRNATHILISIPPDEAGGDIALRDYAAGIPADAWVGYLSTTGVYGDTGGAWVDESSPLLATEPRSQRRIAAEGQWLAHHAHIFRLAGIYGPGRNALEQVRDGTARRINKPGQYFSRIHMADIVQVLLASIRQPAPKQVYNLCDDMPAPSHEVIAYACELLGVQPPPLTSYDKAELSPMAKSFYAANRRVRNDKIKERLGVDLRYPDYRSGLASILHKESE